jgi:putative GTP pyrophosphokinase
MRSDYDQIKSEFLSIVPVLENIALRINDNLTEIFKGVQHVDRIRCRVKDSVSLLKKTLNKNSAGDFKYQIPLKEIQDLIGARVVVYYRTDVEQAKKIISTYYQFVEGNYVVPDDVSKFGYEGFHYVCIIPSAIFSDHKSNLLVPDFFELQIKTLYQHAWSQANHGLGYKPGSNLSDEEQRKLAFIAAQSWGADTILTSMVAANQHKQ